MASKVSFSSQFQMNDGALVGGQFAEGFRLFFAEDLLVRIRALGEHWGRFADESVMQCSFARVVP